MQHTANYMTGGSRHLIDKGGGGEGAWSRGKRSKEVDIGREDQVKYKDRRPKTHDCAREGAGRAKG